MNLIAYMGNNSLEYAGISRADLYVDITGVIEKKVQALDYTSRQFYRGSYSRKRAETDNGAYGNNICVVSAIFSMARYTPSITGANYLKPVWVDSTKCQVVFYHYRLTWLYFLLPGSQRKI